MNEKDQSAMRVINMECGVKIIDNFLDENTFDMMKQALTNRKNNSYFPWYYNDYKVYPNNYEGSTFNSLYNYQFTHIFYNDWAPQSDFYKLLIPLLTKISPLAILRIKGNLTAATDKIYEYGFHTDFNEPVGCTTAIFYMNTNNGYTIFENGEKVESVENRLVSFDSEIKHTGTTCTDDKFRCVINLNYFNGLYKGEFAEEYLDVAGRLEERLSQPESKPYDPMERNADYERGFIDGRADQMKSSVDRAVNKMAQREWVGLSINEAREFYESNLGRADLINKIDEFLQEKNT